jgi:hypothetical protein
MALSREKSLGIIKTSGPERNRPRPYLLGVAEVEAAEPAGFFFFLLCFDFLLVDDLLASAVLVASEAFAGAAVAAGAALDAGAGAGAWAAADSAKAPTRRAVRSLLIVAVFRS